ncbi:MAG: potassium transporter KtrB [Clostridia bacterium]|nr:potassium transporter KtrB [Clostridia bacterium]
MKQSKKITLSTTHIIMLSFICAVIVGSILLSLPLSSATGEAVPYIDALFTAVTSTCVTGLVTVTTADTWSVFGQTVILLLIQAGGLGIITVMSGIMLIINKRFGLNDSVLIQDAFNLNTLSGLSAFVRRVFAGTAVIEGIGALLYMTVFVPEYGVRGIWISVFNSVSAFCNAGIDIIGSESLCSYVTNPVINLVTCALIIMGGIGYIVWWDVIRVLKKHRGRKLFRFLTLQSKLAIVSTAVLIFSGAVLIFIFEYSNNSTVGSFNIFEKIQFSLFQSVTTRTAGFATVPQENLTDSSAMVCLLLMFIGGSPVGTAGGIKTVTFAVLLIAAFSAIRNKNSTEIFSRAISVRTVRKALSVTVMSFGIMAVSTVLLSAVTDADALDVVYETVSATATVGLTRNLTSALDTVGKIIIMITMYLGRVGPISLAVAFNLRKENLNTVRCPEEEISVG